MRWSRHKFVDEDNSKKTSKLKTWKYGCAPIFKLNKRLFWCWLTCSQNFLPANRCSARVLPVATRKKRNTPSMVPSRLSWCPSTEYASRNVWFVFASSSADSSSWGEATAKIDAREAMSHTNQSTKAEDTHRPTLDSSSSVEEIRHGFPFDQFATSGKFPAAWSSATTDREEHLLSVN